MPEEGSVIREESLAGNKAPCRDWREKRVGAAKVEVGAGRRGRSCGQGHRAAVGDLDRALSKEGGAVSDGPAAQNDQAPELDRHVLASEKVGPLISAAR